MTKTDIQRIMDEVPGLNDHGIGPYNDHRQTPAEKEKSLVDGKVKLLESVEECDKTCEWLRAIEKTATINDGYTSYLLKELAEEDIGYITNGVFITAAIYSGYSHRLIPGSANVQFGMSTKSIKAAMKRQKEEGKKNWVVS